MIHDFALTARYVVLLDLPVTFSLNAATRQGTAVRVNPAHQARVGLLPRDGSSPVRWIEIEPCWVFHTQNAYEDAHGRILVDLCQYNKGFDVSTLWAAHGPVTLDQWTIDPAAGTVTQQRLDDRGQEFPRGRRPDHLPAVPLRLQRGHRRGHPGHHGRRRLHRRTRSPTRSSSTT